MKTGSIMRPNSCWTLLDFSVLAALFLSLKADSEDCTAKMTVRRNTVYTVYPGEDLKIECPVEFCNSSPPAVSWVKTDEKLDWVDVTIDSRIKTEWKTLKQNHGLSYLIFQNILKSDSGRYRCKSEDSMSHFIIINATDPTDPTTPSCVKETPAAQHASWHFVCRGLGVMVFFLIVISICMKSNIRCKGKSRNPAELCAKPSNHIYENDP